MTLYQEIQEQPEILKNMFSYNQDKLPSLVAELGPVKGVFIAARGSSDNAARYAKYVWGAFNHIPVTLATPSLFSLYRQVPQIAGYLVLGISQSGQSPDILAVINEANEQGCRTLAITNHVHSPLGQAADFVIDIQAGTEKAVAASKTYTAQLQAIAMLSAAWADESALWEEIESLPSWSDMMLQKEEFIADVVPRYRYMERCVVLGRGFNYATAYEWSLKLKELAYLMADPYSSADFQHGPIAMVNSGFPVFAIAPQGAVYQDMYSLLAELKNDHEVDLFLISDQDDALNFADVPLSLPSDIPEWLTPVVSIIPAQLLCCHLAKEKGFDPDAPRGLTKVTRTT